MATYSNSHKAAANTNTPLLDNFMLYGSGRIGSYEVNEAMDGTVGASVAPSNLPFELTDHLGTVRAVITGEKLDGKAKIVSLTDYYPYGMDMPGRSYTAEAYRYGYQGSERDPDMQGGSGYTTFFRSLDPRIGRWLNPDPKKFPWQSPYCSMDCNPVALTDVLGAQTPAKMNQSTGLRGNQTGPNAGASSTPNAGQNMMNLTTSNANSYANAITIKFENFNPEKYASVQEKPVLIEADKNRTKPNDPPQLFQSEKAAYKFMWNQSKNNRWEYIGLITGNKSVIVFPSAEPNGGFVFGDLPHRMRDKTWIVTLNNKKFQIVGVVHTHWDSTQNPGFSNWDPLTGGGDYSTSANLLKGTPLFLIDFNENVGWIVSDETGVGVSLPGLENKKVTDLIKGFSLFDFIYSH